MKPAAKSVTQRFVSLPLAAAFALLSMRTASADYHSTILADHPVAFYELEETNGSSSVADSSHALFLPDAKTTAKIDEAGSAA